MGLYLGIDLGTSGVRAVAIDEQGRAVGWAHTSLPAPIHAANGVRQAPALWWQAVQQVLHSLLRHIDAGRVLAIAVDGTSGTLLAIDEQGQPLADAIMYNDSSSQAQAAHIRQFAPADAIASSASSGLARCLRLQQEITTPIHRFVTQADWIRGQLSGHWQHSDEHNALKTGYDPLNRQWPEWIWQTGIQRQQLPEVYPPGTPVGQISQTRAREFGLTENCQVMTGTTDSNAALLATGALRLGDAVTSLGSTLVLKVISKVAIHAPQYGVYSHRLGNYWLVGGASNSGGAVLRKYFDNATLVSLSAQIDPERDSPLDYYPLPAPGERFPTNDPQLEPRLLPRPMSDVAFLHGLLQSIARIEQQGYELLRQLGAPYPCQVISAGGGANNPQWQAMRQRLLEVPVKKATQQEAAYGAAKLAFWGHTGEHPYG
ncbi:MAG: FGGY-family carbohydrate kinase [Gammaproteobacteria bacterium]|nr:FGGY-family carbohydrate kinase [Gammaproteobacteria bacterium]